ncbi:hypothetical protein KUCAC02_014262 [Chaenocephalus aceratus]|uniref:Uncharacterized protein n=1 Tax=Chaenocephalus aceratus TaxID=36190 RepID=A0ACB9WE44_CHAAC|nr:hypothetical protein KUCAC02_014262 [Chaenocephalus aceratus]
MPDENEYRVSKTPPRYRQTRKAESLQQATYPDVRWRTAFYEAVDLVHSELSRRFDQDGMRVAAFREKIAIDAANGKPVAVLDAEALKLPTGFDLGRLQLQLQMLGGVFKETVHKTVQEVASESTEPASCCCALVDDELRVDVVTARGFAWLELAHGLTEFLCCEFSREVGIDTGCSRDARHLTRCKSGKGFVSIREAAVLQELGCDGVC